jgi:glycerol-1-phosphate dehydrogenase [NAD(P)+]
MDASILGGLRDRIARCSCGMRHTLAPQEIILGTDALDRAAEELRGRHPGGAALWVLSDEHTEAAAGAAWKAAAAARGATLRERVLPGTPRPVPSLELAGELAAEVRRGPADLLVGVGSGVLSDLVKKVSRDTGVASWCVATAPSVDAYTSATASLRAGGFHQALPARPSEVVVCDLEVLARAPRLLVLAGLGDLSAKLYAHLDWNLAAMVAEEPYCPTVAAASISAAREAMRAARALAADPRAAAAALIAAQLVSGLAMQAVGNSRPAASAEHTIAHYWETIGAVRDEALDLHGLLVGAAGALILPGYLELYRRLPDAPVAPPPSDDVPELDDAMRPFAAKIAQEMGARPRGVVAARRARVARERERIAALAGPLLDEISATLRLLGELGVPLGLDALGIPDDQRMPPVRNVRLLRNRYTSFDLAHELGVLDVPVGAIERAVSRSDP